MKKHVICAVSGGVDSAVAAYLLLKQGFKVTGCYMKNWDRQNEIETNYKCPNDLDRVDAQYVCEKLKIPFIDFDFTKEYWNSVFSYFLQEYEQGLTPNPDILCNKFIKFPLIYEYSKKKFDNIDFIATGHYAKVDYNLETNKHRLLKSFDKLKDQTFFLSQLDSEILKNVLFPVGHLNKNQVREIAKDVGLERVSQKRSSTGICFIGKRNFKSFIDQYLLEKRGNIIDIDTNSIVGEHRGIHHYTIGQKILVEKLTHLSYYVTKKDFDTQNLFIANGTNHPALYCDEFYVDKPHWISENYEERVKIEGNGDILGEDINFKFQHKHNEVGLLFLKKLENRYLIKTKLPFRAITPGQFAVFYKNEECIGSAKIIQIKSSLFDLNFKGSILNTDRLLTKNYSNKNI